MEGNSSLKMLREALFQNRYTSQGSDDFEQGDRDFVMGQPIEDKIESMSVQDPPVSNEFSFANPDFIQPNNEDDDKDACKTQIAPQDNINNIECASTAVFSHESPNKVFSKTSAQDQISEFQMTRCRSFSQMTEVLTVPETRQTAILNANNQTFTEERNSPAKVKSFKSSKSEMIDEDREPIELGEVCQNETFLNIEDNRDSTGCHQDVEEQERPC